MKPRRKKAKIKIEKNYLKGRTYKDFLAFMEKYPDTPVVQIDTVEGKKGHGEAVLLTIHFVESSLMLAFKREANTATSVIKIIDKFYEQLKEGFADLFPVILADRGSELSFPSAIEIGEDGVVRTRVFYTDGGAPFQKGACENNHALIRRIIPKGVSLKEYTSEDIRVLMNHINSYQRKKLRGRSPFDTFNFFHSPLILRKLGVERIDPDQIILPPSLLR